MPHAYTEDQLVEQPAIGLFAELGWATLSAANEAFARKGELGRETSGEIVLVARLRATLEKLNPQLPTEAIAAAVDELSRDRSAMSLPAANREIYALIKGGVPVSLPDKKAGGQRTDRLRVIDWEQPENNDFLLVSQFTVTGPLYTRRPDLVAFVNGLPWVVLEFKKPGIPVRGAFDENLTLYKHPQQGIPALFVFNALLIASNGTESRVGSLTADWERFFQWKRIAREDEPRRVSLEVMLRGTCDKARLLDLVENFTLFSEGKSGLVKIIGQNHQFLGVNNAIESMLAARKSGHGRGGVFWQTQGSGKSYSMVFFAQKVLRKHTGNWTFVVTTDRKELDLQIAATFKACGAVSEAEGDKCHAASGAHLRELLRGNHRYVFTLIHKFQPEKVRAETPSSPALLPRGEGGGPQHYRGGLQDAGLVERARELRKRQLLRDNHRYFFTLIHKFQPEKVRAETPSSPALLPGGEGGGPQQPGKVRAETPSSSALLPGGEGGGPQQPEKVRAETPSSPALLPGGEGGGPQHYRGGLQYAGLVERARELRRHQTPAEEVAWELLRDRRFAGLKFRRQHQLNNYVADFFCAEHQLDIELDGGIHKSPEVKGKDAARDAMLRSLGFKVLRFPNHIVLEDPEEFLRQTAAALELPATSGRGAGGEGHGPMPVLCDRSDVIVLTDEAHRSQYDTLALNMRAALPGATFLAFTGTPLIAGEERTREVFGDYVSIYDFQQSVEDGATVPLFYENRTPELQLVNPALNEDMYRLIEEAELDPEQEAKLERVLSQQYHLLTREDRLETVAKDIVRHFLGRGFMGKAMVVSLDKATALKMHDKVRKHWAAELARTQAEVGRYDQEPAKLAEWRTRLDVLQSTDMALIVSPGQDEIETMKKQGLDIAPHRRRMNEEALDEKFKDPADPLRLVFVCAMWLTGFDAPSCSTLYLDKPMRNHTLMQTIARANRVFPGKHSGMVVDYANVFTALEKALAIYGAGTGGQNPVRDKQKLVAELRQAVRNATEFCARHQVILPAMAQLPVGHRNRLERLVNAVDALISPDPLRREFFGHERLVNTLFSAVKPDPAALEFAGHVDAITNIAAAIRAKLNPTAPDISGIMGGIAKLLNESITGVEMPAKPAPTLDLSKINLAALAQRFRESRHQNTELEVLKTAIRAQLDKLIRLNKTRANFAEKFEELIESYNAGSRQIEDLFAELLNLTRDLTAEEQRHVREHISEEELVIFDILTRPAPDLSPAERAELKKITRDLLAKIKKLLVLNWRQKPSARSKLQLAIQDTLDESLPPAFTQELYDQKCVALFEHFYELYPEPGASPYQMAG